MIPKRGKLSKAAREREGQDWLKEGRQLQAGVESAINNPEQPSPDRVRERSKERFEQVVARSIVASNVHRNRAIGAAQGALEGEAQPGHPERSATPTQRSLSPSGTHSQR